MKMENLETGNFYAVVLNGKPSVGRVVEVPACEYSSKKTPQKVIEIIGSKNHYGVEDFDWVSEEPLMFEVTGRRVFE